MWPCASTIDLGALASMPNKPAAAVTTGKENEGASAPVTKPLESSANARPQGRAKAGLGKLYRYSEVDDSGADDENLRLQVAFSSEYPFERTAGAHEEKLGIAKKGEKYLEVLSHADGDYDITPLNNRGAFLDQHNFQVQLGNVDRAEVSTDKRGRAVLSFDAATDLSKVRYKQMRGKSRPHISFGYEWTRYIGTRSMEDGRTAHVFAWQADEISSVAVPADPTVGANRSGEDDSCCCTKCGGSFARTQVDEDYRCDSCGPVTRSKEKNFSFKTRGGEVSFGNLCQMVAKACQDHEHFKGFYSYCQDVLEDGDGYKAIIYSDGKYWQVGFTIGSGKVVLSETVDEVNPKTEYEVVRAGEKGKVRSAPVDSAASATAVHSAAETLSIEYMPPETTAVDLQKARSDAQTEVVTTLKQRNKEIFERGEVYIAKHGAKSRGKVGEKLRGLIGKYSQMGNEVPATQALAEFSREALEEISSAPMEQYLLRDNGEKAVRDYSLGRAIASCASRDSKMPDGFEKEIHDDMLKRAKEVGLGFEPQGFMVPCDAPTAPQTFSRGRNGRMQRDMQVGQFGQGGAVVPTEFVPDIIGLLRNRLVLARAGCRSISGLQGNIVIPRQVSASNPQWVAEIAALVASNPTFDQIEAKPRRVGNTVNYSKQLVLQAGINPDVEALIRDDNFQQLALKIDLAGLNGQGANSEPLGIMNVPGIGSVNFGAAATYAKIVSMETQIRTANIYDPITYISTSATRGVLRTAPATLTGSTIVSGTSNALWTGSGDNEEMNGRTAFDSQQIPGDRVVAGAFEQFLHLMWGGLDIVVDNVTLADRAEIKLTFNTWNDFIVRHAQAFCVSSDAGNQ